MADDQCPHVGHDKCDNNLAMLCNNNHEGHRACKGAREVRSHKVADPLVKARGLDGLTCYKEDVSLLQIPSIKNNIII